ncbi:MAG TPA: SGNH/GDSL hydrolase family protein [Verrucomicrobiae bacterium]|jgi:lysophospholipase L1-like esterase
MKITGLAAQMVNPALFVALGLFVMLQTGRAADPMRFESEITAFEKSDKTNPPPQNAILFVGSSSIVKWKTLAQDFPTHQVINRGFGGSHLSDSVYFFNRIVAPYHPKTIVLFAGTNDIDARKTPEEVFEDFKAFTAKVHAELPEARLNYISITTSPSRFKEFDKVKKANALIREFISHDDRLTFIDVVPAMLDSDGHPNADIYVGDKLHMNGKGYAIWTSIVGPYLDR